MEDAIKVLKGIAKKHDDRKKSRERIIKKKAFTILYLFCINQDLWRYDQEIRKLPIPYEANFSDWIEGCNKIRQDLDAMVGDTHRDKRLNSSAAWDMCFQHFARLLFLKIKDPSKFSKYTSIRPMNEVENLY